VRTGGGFCWSAFIDAGGGGPNDFTRGLGALIWNMAQSVTG